MGSLATYLWPPEFDMALSNIQPEEELPNLYRDIVLLGLRAEVQQRQGIPGHFVKQYMLLYRVLASHVINDVRGQARLERERERLGELLLHLQL